MSKINVKYVFGTVLTIVVLYSIYSVVFCIRTIRDQIDVVVISVTTGIISGIVANWIYRLFEDKQRLRTITERLKPFEGTYNVYHWRDLTKPDDCKYVVQITVDDQNGVLRIKQTGTEDDHELDGNVKMNDLTFDYGEGNYSHPKKRGTPTGRIQLYLVSQGTINVDKYYLDDSGQKPGFEKWQWRKS